MTTPNRPTESRNIYFVDHESGAEMVRLLDQDHLFTQGMGGLLSERSNDFAGIQHVLDVACGPGGWAMEVAFAHPDVEVVGFDISRAMINYARAQAQLRQLDNVRFEVMDLLQPLDFPNDSFDLVNARLIGFLSPTDWPKCLREFLRITRSGGTIRLTETELGVSTSAALERYQSWFTHALYSTGQSFSPNGRMFCITAMLGRLLRNVGCRDVQYKAHVIEYSIETAQTHVAFYEDWKVAYKLLEPFFINTGVATQEEVDRAYEQMLVEMLADDFCAVHFLVTAWGQKP